MQNDKALKNLLKALDNTPYGIGHAILRERILKIAEMTKQHINENPEAWVNPIISQKCYIDFCDIVENTLSFDNK